MARSPALSEIVSSLALTNAAAWLMPLNVTVDEARNPVPLIVSACDGELTGRDAGSKGRVIVGAGLLAGITVMLAELERGEPELEGTIAGIVAVT